MSTPSQSVVVVGAGVFGLAAALELARRKWQVTLLDPGPLPHPLAASTDRSKVIRMDYGRDREISLLAQRALEQWSAWNRERFARPLFHRTGFLLLSGESLEAGGFEMESFALLRERGMPVERVDPATLHERFPAWSGTRFPDGYLSLSAGWAESGPVIGEMLGWARQAGVEVLEDAASGILRTGSRVQGVERRSGAAVEGDAVVVAAGSWTPRLLPELRRVLRPSAMPVLLFRPRDPRLFQPERFPVWGADIARTGWYGFPAGADGIVKMGHHGRGWDGDPDHPGEVPRTWEERARAFLAESVPGLAHAPLAGGRVCFYCDTRDGDFWIARHPEVEGLTVATGGSGHGFKFAPVLGGLVANAVEGREDPRLQRFRWRPDAAESAEDARYRGH